MRLPSAMVRESTMAEPGEGCNPETADAGDDWRAEPVGVRIEMLDLN